jgi:hypothetical protein
MKENEDLSFWSCGFLELRKMEEVKIFREIGADEEFALLYFALPIEGDKRATTEPRLLKCYCRDREFYGRLIEGHSYRIFGFFEFFVGGLRVVVNKIVGYDDNLELTDPWSVYFYNLEPIEIGSLVPF